LLQLRVHARGVHVVQAEALLAPTSGQVAWAATEAAGGPRRQAMVFQRPVMLRRSALANVSYALKAASIPWPERDARARAALEHVGLLQLADHPARVLSGGEQQRLALARIMYRDADIWILDEPTSGLGAEATRKLSELIRKLRKRYTIVMIGHEGHEEVEGTTGEAPESIILIETADEVETLEVPDPDRVAFITQTTLSVDETADVIAALRSKFPGIVSSKSDDICYATTNRQIAVKQLARECELVLVIGSTNSSNSNRLVEVAREHGADSHLIDNHAQVEEAWLEGVETVGITSGASAPEELVERLVELFRERGAEEVSELRTVHEDVRFMLPKEIRAEVAARS